MLHVTCVACGVDGILLADESTGVPRCLQCGRPFRVSSVEEARPRVERRPTEELIATWLGPGPGLPDSAKFFEFACRFCGYLGPTPPKDRMGVVACPACRQFERPPRRNGRSRTVCVNCELVFELSAHDRGRTVLCPGCNYFLGCLLPIERQRLRPFWSRR
jgi:hypothetical protein